MGPAPGCPHRRPGHVADRRSGRARSVSQHPEPADDRGRRGQHRRNAGPALLPSRSRRWATVHRRLHPIASGPGQAGRPSHHRRPRELGDPGPRLRLLRRVENGLSPDVGQAGARLGRARPPRRAQDLSRRVDPIWRRGVDADHRPLRDRQDDHHLPSAGGIAPGAGRLRGPHARRGDPHHRERLLRQDVWPRRRRRAHHLRGDHQARRMVGECLGHG